MEQANEGQTLLKIPEAARRLGVSRATVYRLIASGQLGTVTVKTPRTTGVGITRVPSGSVDAYIKSMSKAATA